jgi:hypothetical protein
MSEEQENDGTWSGLKKTIIGTIATAVTAGGAWFTSTLFGGNDDKEEPKTEQVAPAPVINLNVDNSSKNTNSGGGGTTTIIKEKTVEKAAHPATVKPEKKSETEDAPW